jgi:hypothetical protein
MAVGVFRGVWELCNRVQAIEAAESNLTMARPM